MSELARMIEKINEFRRERDWGKHHRPKELAMGLIIEAGELLEHFLWRQGDELDEYLKMRKEDVSDELADVLYFTLLLSHELGIDMNTAFAAKLEKTKKKYPADKVKGRIVKYTEL